MTTEIVGYMEVKLQDVGFCFSNFWNFNKKIEDENAGNKRSISF